jgi:hypothetical protein
MFSHTTAVFIIFFAALAGASLIECDRFAFCTPVVDCDAECLWKESALELAKAPLPVVPAEIIDTYLPLSVSLAIWVLGICLVGTAAAAMCALIDGDDE